MPVSAKRPTTRVLARKAPSQASRNKLVIEKTVVGSRRKPAVGIGGKRLTSRPPQEEPISPATRRRISVAMRNSKAGRISKAVDLRQAAEIAK